MILAWSRFKVANGAEKAVAEAFLRRPRRVDAVRGFLGLEVFTDKEDSSVFHLVTRWTDEASFRAWHAGPEHASSHAFIPKGLKLDAAYTRLLILERLPARTGLEDLVVDGAPAIASFLAGSWAVCALACGLDGLVRASNGTLERRLGTGPLAGGNLWERLTEADASSLRERVARAERLSPERFVLNFVDAARSPFSLRCRIDVQPGGFLLLGESCFQEDENLQRELIRLNNELTTVHRESLRKGRELSEALRAERTLSEELGREVERRSLAEKRLEALTADLESLVASRTRDLQRAVQELERFSYTVAHDLRAPLRAISQYCQLVAEDYGGRILREEGMDHLGRAAEAARTLDALILGLLEFSELQRLELRAEPLDVDVSAEHALKELSSEITRTGADVIVEHPLPRVLAHAETFERVLKSLLINAIKFVPPERTPRIRIRGELKTSRVRLWVEDNGVGIPAPYQDRVFGVFERLDPSGGRSGTGIGLAIVKRAVERMNGTVGVESQPGQGSRFFVELPEAA